MRVGAVGGDANEATVEPMYALKHKKKRDGRGRRRGHEYDKKIGRREEEDPGERERRVDPWRDTSSPQEINGEMKLCYPHGWQHK